MRSEQLESRQKGRLPALSRPAPTADLTGKLDQFKKSDPCHIQHQECARYENYLGTSKLKGHQRQVGRVSPGYTMLDVDSANNQLPGQGTVVTLGTLELTTENRKIPVRDLSLVWCRGRLMEVNLIRKGGKGVFSKSHPDYVYHQEKMLLVIGRYQYLEGCIFFLEQDLGVAWQVGYFYLVFIVRDKFRFYGGNTGISHLDQMILSHMRDAGELQLTASTRMRDLVRATKDEALLLEASKVGRPPVAPTVKPKPAVAPRNGTQHSQGGAVVGGSGGSGERESGPPRMNKYEMMAKELNLPTRPGPGESYKEWKPRVAGEYLAQKGREWSPQ